MINVRPVQQGDITSIVDIDLKCFEDALSLDEWRTVLNDPHMSIKIGLYRSTPVGCIVWDVLKGVPTIFRLAVKPAFRGNGLGRLLITSVVDSARLASLHTIAITVTESMCNPTSHMDVSQWLIANGFEAKRILKDKGVFCGQKEDAFEFQLNIKDWRTRHA